MIARLEYLQQQIDKQLEPFKVKGTHENRLFDLVIGENRIKLVEDKE